MVQEPHAAHGHVHSHPVRAYNRAFLVGLSLNLIFVGTEVAFGVRSGSLALIADAGHNLTDVLALAIGTLLVTLVWLAIGSGTYRLSPDTEMGSRSVESQPVSAIGATTVGLER